jgi:hypothetical protein
MTRANTLVDRKYLKLSRDEVSEKGPSKFLEKMAEAQPALASYLEENLTMLAGKLALCGVPTGVIQGAHEDALGLFLICIDAYRRAVCRDRIPASSAASHDNVSRPQTNVAGSDSRTTTENAARRIGF